MVGSKKIQRGRVVKRREKKEEPMTLRPVTMASKKKRISHGHGCGR